MSDAPSSLIDPARLPALMGRAALRFDVDAVAVCESTNTVLMQRASAGAASGSVLVADRQTGGRGSRGRQWHATVGAGLTFSVLWHFAGGIERLSGLSLAVGVAVAQALADCGAIGVRLKWPNDILFDGGKLGGILVELQSEMQGGGGVQAVIGIGLNLHAPGEIGAAGMAALPPASMESMMVALPDRNVLLASLLSSLAHVLDDFAQGGFAAVRAAWQGYHAWQDRPVRVWRDARVDCEGVCAGADDDGALLIRTGGRLVRCLSGDVSLRPQ